MRACVYTIQLIETFFVGISHFIMDSESECAAAVIIVTAISKKRKRIRKKRLRSIWVKPWLGRRNDLGVDNTLLREFWLEDSDEYKKFLRMSPENFDDLLRPSLLQFVYTIFYKNQYIDLKLAVIKYPFFYKNQ